MFEEVIKLDPEGKTSYADDAALKLAVLPADERNFASATVNLEKFLAEFPKSEHRPEALLYLGRCKSSSAIVASKFSRRPKKLLYILYFLKVVTDRRSARRYSGILSTSSYLTSKSSTVRRMRSSPSTFTSVPPCSL